MTAALEPIAGEVPLTVAELWRLVASRPAGAKVSIPRECLLEVLPAVGNRRQDDRERCGTLRGAASCARETCRRPFAPRDVLRLGGRPQRFCSTRCRLAAWRAAHPRRAAGQAAPTPTVPLGIRRRQLELRERERRLAAGVTP